MAEIQKPSDQNQTDDSKAGGKPDSLNPDCSVSGADVGNVEKKRVNKFITFGQMTTIKDGDSLDDAAHQDGVCACYRGAGLKLLGAKAFQ